MILIHEVEAQFSLKSSYTPASIYYPANRGLLLPTCVPYAGEERVWGRTIKSSDRP